MPTPTLAHPPFVVDPKRHYSLDEWQAIEELTGERFEYHRGRLVPARAMAGGTGPHALIGGNVIGSLFRIVTQVDNGVKRSSCGVYSSDLRLMLEAEQRYVYPDAAVVCGEPEYDAAVPTAVRNPLLVVEVISPGSSAFDTGPKFDYYAALPSLREYVLVAQDAARVEVRARADAAADWTIAVADGREVAARLPSLAAELPLAEVYRLVTF